MPDNINNDYNELAKLIYPSIEASGNVYYGQTRKLAIDELFNINDGGFESSIKTIRRQTDNNEDGFEYISYFCWKFGPLNGRIRIVPCGNDKFIFTFANFPELEKIYHLDDTYIANDSTDPIVGTLFIRYKLLLNDSTVEHILNSGTFNSYEKIISLDTNDIRVYITDNCDPTNIDNRDIDDRNIFVKHENDAYYLFVKLCKCAVSPGDALYFINMNDGESTVKLIVNGELQTDYEYYKSSLERWGKYNIGDVITLANRNDKVYFRGSRSQQDFDNYIQFNLTGKLSAGGNINSLLSPDESVYKNITDYTTFETANEQTFYSLFFNQSSLYDASLLKLNAHNLANSCYSYMFYGCTSLNQAPELPATTLSNNCYDAMFYDCTSLVQAPELPATTLANSCYYVMFTGCTSLNQAPELPATTLADYCYYSMFQGCSSLTQAPELPATTLANSCYSYMFQGCSSLTQAPELPATTLAQYCYSSMFQGCSSLTQAPELPATTLANYCYNYMFYGCRTLNYIKCLATDIVANSMTGWVTNVAATGTFECDNKKYFTLDSPNGIPVGWTITEINPDQPEPEPDLDIFNPEIPFCIENIGDVPVEVGLYNHSPNTQVRINCKISYDLKTWQNYSLALAINPKDSLIGKITLANKGDRVYIKADLNTKPSSSHYTHLTVLNSSKDTKIRARGNIASINKGTNDVYKTDYLTADDHGYLYLFSDCASLIQAPELPATILSDGCYMSMFFECRSLTQAPELPATTLAEYCYSNMFENCYGLTQAPTLPATTLAKNCYSSMFYYCNNLTQPPELPATNLAEYCYYNMFRSCYGLTQVPVLPATTLAEGVYANMFYNCNKLVAAPDLPAPTLATYCYNSMFRGCHKLNSVKCLATNISASECTKDWLYNAPATGDFYTPVSTAWLIDNDDGIPTGWTRHDV